MHSTDALRVIGVGGVGVAGEIFKLAFDGDILCVAFGIEPSCRAPVDTSRRADQCGHLRRRLLSYRCCWTSPLLTDWGVVHLRVHAKLNICG